MHFQIKYTWYLQNITGFIISEKIKTVKSFKQYFLKNSPLVHYIFLPATVKLLEIFLEPILWKPFQLSHCIPNVKYYENDVPSMLTPVEGTGKNQLEPGQNSMGDASELLHCSFLGSFDQNRPVCWSIIVKEIKMFLHFSGYFFLTASQRRRIMSMYISLFTV